MFYVLCLKKNPTQKLSSICLSLNAECYDKSVYTKINNYQVQNVSIAIHNVKVNWHDELWY